MIWFLDDLVSDFQCHMIKTSKHIAKESGDVSFAATIAICVLVAVVLLTVFIFRNNIMVWWYDLWHSTLPGPGSVIEHGIGK